MRPGSGQCSQWQKGASLATGKTEGSVSIPNAAPLRARRPPHLLPVGYTSSPRRSFIPWSEDSSWAVDLLLCTTIIDYVNVLNSSQTGLKWRHSDFFPFSLLCCLCKCNQLYWGWVLLLFRMCLGKSAFFSLSLFFSFTNTEWKVCQVTWEDLV